MARSQAEAAAEWPADPRPEPPYPLTDRDRKILVFERQWWSHAGAKERAIREEFGLSTTRYYQLVNQLIDKRAALAADPMLVKRLRRLRAGRLRKRSATRLGIEKP
ncbi:MAG TPA: DUF3263 domain-containing protein [Actinophytocola sp.]|uniref:DUF3263 domain-containing protein n=1 Tax=Actinophytocola sp. TaxID=1872138 RepID=UPI002DFE2BE5|nr:DUF3263 domain-containing protein [Actinophytocola sp.]